MSGPTRQRGFYIWHSTFPMDPWTQVGPPLARLSSLEQRYVFLICHCKIYLWIVISVARQVILVDKYLWQPTCTSSTQTYGVTWQIRSVFEHQSWTCYWCPSLVVWAQACLPSPSPDGVGLFIYPRCVLFQFLRVLPFKIAFSHFCRCRTDFQPGPTSTFTHTK